MEWKQYSVCCESSGKDNSPVLADHPHSFQEVQDLSAFQAALRFLPNVIIGILLNVGTGLLVHRLHADHLVLVSTFLSAGSPLLMAIIDPSWSWWYCAFWAVLLGPLSADGNEHPCFSAESPFFKY